jgi:dihydrofolate reductase
MIFSLIVAAAENDIIGRDGALPWRIRADSRRFRALTTGHVVLLGRVTHDSIVARLGRPLPGRTSVVITRAGAPPAPPGAETGSADAGPAGARSPATASHTPDSSHTASHTPDTTSHTPATSRLGTGQVLWAGSVESGLGLAERTAAAAGDPEVFIAGGVSIYRDTLPVAGRIYLTRVNHVVPGDRAMPPGWLTGFGLVRREDGMDEESQLSYSFLDYERARR